MPDHIDMPSVAADEQLGPHNVFWQSSALGTMRMTVAATTARLDHFVNLVEPGGGTPNCRTGAGTYQVLYNAFDRVPAGIVPVSVFLQYQGVSALHPTIISASETTLDFAVLSSAGAPTDIGLNEKIHILLVGRRVKNSKAITLGAFRTIGHNMGVPGL